MHSQTRTTAVYQFAIDNSQLPARDRGKIQHRTLFHVPFCVFRFVLSLLVTCRHIGPLRRPLHQKNQRQ
jgi:hypothetical protein